MKTSRLFLIGIFLLLIINLVSASRLPTIGGDDDSWGIVLNDFLSKIAGSDGVKLNETMVNGTNIYSSSINTTHILDGTITADDLGTNSVSDDEIDYTTVTISKFTNDANFLDKDEGGTIDGNVIINGNLSLIGSYFNTTVTNQYLNGSFLPSITNLFDLGSSSFNWKDLFINSVFLSGNLNVSGGINTTGSLHITESKGVTPSISTDNDNIIIQNNALASDDVGMTFIAGASGSVAIDFGDNDSSSDGQILYSNSARSMYFKVFGATQMTLLGNGQFGVGMIPTAYLSARSTSTIDLLNLFETDGDEVFTVLESGNVGIGVTNPSEKLNVSGNIGATGNITASYYFGDASQLTNLPSSGLWTNSSGNATFTSGNVGIGTTTPTHELNVVGSVNVTQNITLGNCIIFASGGKICDSP